MKKMVLVIPSLLSGGAERVISQISCILVDNGYEVKLVVFNATNIHYKYKGELIELDPKVGKNLVEKLFRIGIRGYRLRKILKRDKEQKVISFLNSADIVNFIAGTKNKKLYSIRGYEDYYRRKLFYHYIIKRTKNKILVQTETLKKDILNNIGDKYNMQVLVLENPFDVEEIKKLSDQNIRLEEQELLKGNKNICSVGSFKQAKNQWNLLKSFEVLKKRLPEAKLFFIGGNGPLEKQIKEMANKSEYNKDIVFIGIKENPFNIMKECDVFVLPSLSEGMPNVLIEAMICGMPVIATDCKTGPREILYNNPDFNVTTEEIEFADYGIMVRNFDKKIDYNYSNISESNLVLADAMYQVLSSEKIKERYRKLSVERADYYNLNNYAKKLINMIEKLQTN